jgi:outer membrane autotransporter protein
MAKKQKLLKNLLTSVSVASIVASIGGSSGAFAFNLGDGPLVNLSGVVGFGGAGPGARELNFNRPGVTLTVDIKEDIADIITTEAGNIIIAESMAITGAVAPPLAGPNSATATINDNKTLTLSGVNHIGLGAVTLNGAGSTLLLKHTAILPAAVITTNADGKGILTFNETGTVTGNIGTNAAALAQINIGDDAAGGDVILQGDVFTRRLVFNNASEVKIAGNFGGGDNAIAGASAVDFGTGGMLTFNGGRGAGDLKTFNATIDNGANGALNVLGRLKAIHANIGNIQTINIGDADEGYLTIDASAGNVKLLGDGGSAVQEINFGHANSVLGLYTNTDHTITFYDHLPGTVGNTGIVLLEGAGGHTLTVDSDGAKTLGTAAQLLTRLDVRGQVTIAGRDADRFGIHLVPELNVIKGAVFTDEGATSAQIAAVNIGVGDAIAGAAPGAGDPGKANYVLDAKYGDFGILNGGKAINFLDAGAQLTLRNSSANNKTITFYDNLEGLVGGGGGVLSLESTGGLLTVDSDGAKTLGAGRALTRLDVRGQVTIAGRAANGLDIKDVPELNVIKGAVFTDEGATSAQIAAVNIGVGDATAGGADAAAIAARAPGEANYVLDAKYAHLDNLAILNGKRINFKHQDAQLTLRNSDNTDRTITLHANLEGFNHPVDNYGGIVLLENKGTGLLTLQSHGGVKTLGTDHATGGHEIDQLRVSGQVTINGNGVNAVNVSNAKTLNVIKGAVFTDESRTSATIPVINIGVANPALLLADRVPGEATYVLDAKYADFNLIGNNINFSHEDGRLILRNSDNTGVLKTITLANTLNPGNAANGKGIVELNSVAGGLLKITKAAAHSLGTNLNKLKEVEFSGAGDITIEPIIYAHTITSNATGTVTTNDLCGNVTLNANGQLTGNVIGNVLFNVGGAKLDGNVNGIVVFYIDGGQLKGDVTGGVAFAAAGQLTGNVIGNVGFDANGIVSGDVTGIVTVNGGNSTVGGSIGSVAFTGNGQLTANKGVAGEVDFNNQTGTVTVAHQKTIGGTIKNGEKATVEFARDGAVTNVIEKLKLLKAGNGNVTLGAGKHTIEEIQGNGTQTLTFADKFNSTGAINKTGGAAVNLIFEGSSIIGGVVGSDKYPVGNIQIKAGTVAFGDSINSKERIEIAKGATTVISKNFTVKSIKGEGTVRFNNLQELILNTPIEIGTIEIAGDNIQATKKISTGNVLFSNSKEAILTLKEESIISNIETTGNSIHSLALNANLTIKAGNVGSESNRLKEIKLLGNHTISIIGNSLYSNISTANKDSGIVMFNSDDSVAHGNLGTNEFRLSDVTFDSDSTAGGDVYSKKITIKDKKTATFAGTEKRTIDVPGVPRLLKDFAYSTKIGSEEINAEGSSKIQFKSGALVEAPINGGEVILADNVWFKEKVTSAAPVTFAADKYAILEKDVKFASIAANQAKIIMLGEKQTITGDLTAKDLTMDLGTSQVEYGNTAKLTGELKLRSFYDSSKLAGGNIKIQSNGKLDISQLDKLVVTIAGQTDISEIPDETEYVLISSVDANGISLDPSKVDLEINEQSSFVSWTIDPSNLTLHAKDIHKQVIEKDVIELDKESAKTQDPDAASRLSERAALLKQLNNVTDKDSDAFKYLGEIGLMDKGNRALAMDKLLPGNTNPISMELAFMVNEAISQVASQIASRSVNIMPVASGDDDKVTYGVWGSPFYAVGHQEMRKGISGYRSKSVGGIFGFDGLINDDLLVGVAYSKIDTKMSHKDMKFGDKTNGITNLFSLYGSYKFPSNFFAEVVASYGITDIKNAEGRLVLDDNKKVTTGTAVAKYKSTSYSGQLLTGYNYQPSEKLTITPTIGLRYSQFMDDGHVQSGTAWQNLTVKKTSYNKFEGILGLRTAANIQLDQLLLIPELHGYVNYDFKGKSPKIDARLGGVNEPLPTKSVKPAKVSFTVGTGLTVKSNMMEYGVTYNAHIADKYIGHQGSLKVKVNF